MSKSLTTIDPGGCCRTHVRHLRTLPRIDRCWYTVPWGQCYPPPTCSAHDAIFSSQDSQKDPMDKINIEVTGVYADDDGIFLVASGDQSTRSIAIPIGTDRGLEIAKVLLDGGRFHLECTLVEETA